MECGALVDIFQLLLSTFCCCGSSQAETQYDQHLQAHNVSLIYKTWVLWMKIQVRYQ